MHDVPKLVLTPIQREALRSWSRERPGRDVRARIVLDAADGVPVSDSARALGVSRPTVSSWRARYADLGLPGLEHRPRAGRPPRIDEAEVVASTLAGPPPPRPSWSARSLAEHLGMSHTTLGAVWRRWGVDGEGASPVTLPTSPPLTCREPLLLGLWQQADSAVVLLAEVPPGRSVAAAAPFVPAPADERQALAATLAAALPGTGTGADADAEAVTDGVTEEGGAALSGLLAAVRDEYRGLAVHAIALGGAASATARGGQRAAGPETWHTAGESMSWAATLAVVCQLQLRHSPSSAGPVHHSLVEALHARAGRALVWRRPSGGAVTEPQALAPRAFDQLALGSFNEKLVIESIREAGSLSRVEIAQRTGLTPQAVSRITRNLLTSSFLVEDTVRPGIKGKPRVPLRLRADAACALGIHLDPEMITQVVVDLCGGVRDQRVLPLHGRTDPASVIDSMTRLAREAIASGAVSDPLLGIGVAVPGPLDAGAGVLCDPPLFEGWRDVPLRAALTERLGVPVTVEKDATAAAIGERWIGATERSGDFIYLYLGTGAGAGAFLNGDVYRGRTGNAGEFGELCALSLGLADPEAEQRVRVPECAPMSAALGKAAAAGLRLPDAPGRYERLCAAAAEGDERAVTAIREVAKVLARGATGMIDLLDTTLLIVGGPAVPPSVVDVFLTEMSAAVNRFPLARRLRRVRVEHSVLNDSAAAVGAASGVFHSAFAPRLRTLSRAEAAV
ncbi:ROK family protein [Streptomyces avicenniae]|uniref:ROK family protein n=1 Tax=Streptomyces avicenniae TaxID=500153 RepID=UPI0006993C9C|nr:ROK family protein [Streptomyces avicenniae]